MECSLVVKYLSNLSPGLSSFTVVRPVEIMINRVKCAHWHLNPRKLIELNPNKCVLIKSVLSIRYTEFT